MNDEWDHIVSMKATFNVWENNKKVGETTYSGIQAWSMLAAHHKPYNGVPKLKQLPAGKRGYKTLNPMGGRKCIFTQSPAYKRKGYFGTKRWASGVIKLAAPWYGWEEPT